MKPYSDPILEKYAELLKANCQVIKTYFQGEPTRIASVDMPTCILSKLGTRVEPFTNAEDRHRIAIRITIVADIRSDLSTEENDAKIVEGVNTLYDIIEGRNASDLSLKTTSVLGALRGNILLDSGNELRTDLDTPTEVDYGATLDTRDSSLTRIEARVDIVAHYTQAR